MAEHSHKKSSAGKKVAMGCGAFTLVLLLILAGLTAWLFIGTGANDPFDGSDNPIAQPADGSSESKARYLLLIGVDGDGSAVQGQRSDMILLNRLLNGQIDSVSIPRDLLVDMPSCTGEAGQQKVNGIFAYSSASSGVDAGARCLSQAIADLSGVRIDDYVVINMNSVVTLVDAVGGVEICIDQGAIDDRIIPEITAPGCYNLNGRQALAYARARKYVDDGSDLSRINRQHEVLAALVKKVKAMQPTKNIPTMVELANVVNGNTESNLGLTGARTMVQLSRTVAEASLPPAQTLPTDPAGDGANLVMSPASEELFKALREGAELPPAQ